MAGEQSKPADITNWFIGISVLVVLVGGWWGMGQPGLPLKSGDYSCSTGALIADYHLGATVRGGEVVDVFDYDLRANQKRSVSFSDAERESSREFTVTTGPRGISDMSYRCNAD